MANRDFEIDLRMKADFASAQRELKRTQDEIRKIGEATSTANAEMASLGKTKTSGGTGGSAEIEAQTAALGRNLQARQSIATASSLTQRAVAAEIGLIRDLQSRLESGARDFDALAATEARLDAAMSKGLITTEEYEDALDKLNDEQARLTRESDKSGKAINTTIGRYDKASAGLQRLQQDEARLKQAVDSGRISREQYNRALAGIGDERARLIALRDGANQAANGMRTLNLQSRETQRNLSQLLTSGVTGQWQLAGSQLLQLGNQAGIAGGLASGAGIAVAGLAVAVTGLTAALAINYLQQRALDTALVSTGHIAGVTAGQLSQMRNEIGAATGDYAAAQTSLQTLTASGQLTGEALQSAGRAAVELAQLTGQSIEDTTSRIIALAKSPAASLLELNDRYHFLTLEVYEHVKSLEEQGRTQEAVRVATEALAAATASRVAEMRANAGSLERAWYDVRDAVRSAWQMIKDIGRDDAEARIAAGERGILLANQQRAELNEQVRLGILTQAQADKANQTLRERIANERKNIEQWRERKNVQDAAADTAAEEQRIRDKTVQASAELDRDIARIDKKAERQQRLNRLIEQYNFIFNADPNDSRLYDGSYERLKKAIEEETSEKKTRTPKGPKPVDPNKEALREVENLQKQVTLLGDLEEGETKASEAARIRYEIEDGAYKNASDSVKAQLIDQAQLLDHERRKVEITKELKSVDLKTLELQGKGASAAVAETIAKLEKLKLQMLNAGSDDAGVAKVDKLIDLTNAKAQLEELEQTWQRVTGEIGREQQRIQTEQQAGLITEYDAQQRIVDLYREKGVVLGQLLPQMEALAQRLGDPQAIENVRAIRAEFAQMQATTSLLQQQIGSTFQGAFSSALESLITRTATLGEAVRGFLSDMASGLARMASAALAQAAWSKIVGLFSKGAGDGAGVGAGAEKLQRAGLVTAGGGLAVKLGAGALSTSAQELMAAATMLLVANSASGFSGGGSVSAATGGHIRGPGTSTSDSIRAWLSDGEFVTRAAVVAQPGALNFLSEFNRYGMSTLGDWGNRYAAAGAPGRSPSVPRFQFADGGLAQAASGAGGQANRLSVYVVHSDDQLLERLSSNPRFEKMVVAFAGQNGTTIRSEW